MPDFPHCISLNFRTRLIFNAEFLCKNDYNPKTLENTWERREVRSFLGKFQGLFGEDCLNRNLFDCYKCEYRVKKWSKTPFK